MAIIIGNNMAKVLERIGLKGSDLKKQKAKKQQLREQKALNIDAIEEIKDKIIAIEDMIKRKNRQMKKTTGIRKRMLKDEIIRFFKEIDTIVADEEKLLSANIDKINVTLSKYRITDIIENLSLNEADLEDLANELEDSKDIKNATDIAFNYLNKIDIVDKVKDYNVDARFNEFNTEIDNTIADDELPEELIARIAEMEE